MNGTGMEVICRDSLWQCVKGACGERKIWDERRRKTTEWWNDKVKQMIIGKKSGIQQVVTKKEKGTVGRFKYKIIKNT